MFLLSVCIGLKYKYLDFCIKLFVKTKLSHKTIKNRKNGKNNFISWRKLTTSLITIL